MTDQYGDVLTERLGHPNQAPEELGRDAYDLLKEVQCGYPVSNLVPLLRSDNQTTVEAAAWVVSELGVKAAPLIDEIEPLLGSPSRKVRYWAIDIVHSSAGAEDGRLIGKVFGLLEDSDVAVRRAALYFLAMASGQQLVAGIGYLGDTTKLGDHLGWLNRVTKAHGAVSEIVVGLESSDPLVRLFSVAAASRISGPEKSVLLQRAAAMDDDEVSLFASRQLIMTA